MKLKFLFFLLLCLPNFIVAQVISGQVIDDQTKQPLMGVHVYPMHETTGTVSDQNGFYTIECKTTFCRLRFIYPGYTTRTINAGSTEKVNIALVPENAEMVQMDTVITFDPETYEEQIAIVRSDRNSGYSNGHQYGFLNDLNPSSNNGLPKESLNTNDFSPIQENGDHHVLDEPLSTFSIDVDNASYSIVRNHIQRKQPISKDAIRLEEMINYFDYDYPQPKKGKPFSINTEIADCPWNKERKLLHIGLQGREIKYEKLPPNNLVFLLDASGSMRSDRKFPLLKKAFQLLVAELRPEDKVSIVVYAGAAGLVLEPTRGDEKEKILEALDRIRAGGSTAGGAGIQLAYKTAKEQFLPDGNNRVILATDGDFNVGVSSDGELTRLIEEKRKDHIFLTVLGFGMDNYKDNKLELLADKGNGQYAYIDSEKEAKKVFVHQLRGSLFSIAKDVKIQIEFNPYLVESYRLIGYENRLLNKEDFQDDRKDAGELGVGHTVTALYELVLANGQTTKNTITETGGIPLLYQQKQLTSIAKKGKELGQIRFRYKTPKGETSELIEQKLSRKLLKNKKSSTNFRFATAVAGFGILLRQSKYNKTLGLEQIKILAQSAMGKDKHEYRAEFIQMIEQYMTLQADLQNNSDF